MKDPVIIVGLGNPGGAYQHTRHNAGFDVVETLARRWGWKIKKAARRCLLAEGRREGNAVVLALPQTYMNESGQAVVALMNWYKPKPSSLIVAYDDVDLPMGAVRVRAGGGPGTHNGMRSILALLGHEDFPRVRVGVGAPPEDWDLKDWVLSKRREEESSLALEAMVRAVDALELFAQTRDIERVMRTYNRKE